MPNFGRILTGMQIGAGVAGTLGTVAITKSLLDEAIEIAPYVLGGTVMIGSIIIIVKFA